MSTPQPPGNTEQPASPVTPPAPPTAASARAKERWEEDLPSTWQPWLYVRIGLLVLALGWVTAFVVENSKQVHVHFVFGTANVRLIWTILLCLVVGLVAGLLISQLYRHRRRAKLAKKAGKPDHARAAVRR